MPKAALAPEVAALVDGLETDLNRVVMGAAALVAACGKPAAQVPVRIRKATGHHRAPTE